MNQPVSPPKIELITESAPFTTEQRSWLNGFFAGLISLDGAGVTALSPEQSAALMPGAPAQSNGPLEDGDDGETPWHDQTLPMSERMELAQGRPLRRRLMAAMAQQDCGQCGYNCEDYSNALFLQSEARLNLCVPGGKETARMLKNLHAELGASDTAATPATLPTPADATAAPPQERGRSRDNPTEAIFLSRTRLNKPGSEKETWHVEFDLTACGLDYVVGDSFGVFPINDPELVAAILEALNAPADFLIGERTLGDVLTCDVSLAPAPDALFQLFSYITGGARRLKAKALSSGEDPDGDAASMDVLAALEKFSGARPDPEAFIEALDPLQPRLYSISSSIKADPGRISLTVDTVRYAVAKRERRGVASTFLGNRIKPGDKLRVYVQKAHAFGLPADADVPVIMVGPGTGIAPFRAFLHDRMATKAPGRNWLFFGHQRRDHDFFYEDELNAMKTNGVLTRLSLAWSRDTGEKFYVQDRMREVGPELWTWLNDGAHLYVCGDAKRMAKDVERALVDIVAQFGKRSTDEAISFVADLKKKGRYQQDVY
jgi:sulfite reductase (NADPH) flavoprotein alpha-component